MSGCPSRNGLQRSRGAKRSDTGSSTPYSRRGKSKACVTPFIERKSRFYLALPIVDRSAAAIHTVHGAFQEEDRYRVVVLIDLPSLWQSELLIFESNERLKAFMERNTSEQTWTSLSKDHLLLRRLNLPEDVDVHRFHELIQDEDYMRSGEVWLLVQ